MNTGSNPVRVAFTSFCRHLRLPPRLLPRRTAAILGVALCLAGCADTPPYRYEYIPGRTATLNADGTASTPPLAPLAVRAAIAAGNEIAGSPYQYGGGHGERQGGFDCSGATSYVLRGAGRLRGSMPSEDFRSYGEGGPGRWISVYARDGHVFLVVAGLRFDTGYTGRQNSGPQWTRRPRPADGCVVRHPAGL